MSKPTGLRRYADGPTDGADFVIAVIARPLMFVTWAYILWGTLYGAALAYATATEGPSALGRVLYGGDPFLGILSFAASFLAAVVWSIIGVFAALNWLRRTYAKDTTRAS